VNVCSKVIRPALSPSWLGRRRDSIGADRSSGYSSHKGAHCGAARKKKIARRVTSQRPVRRLTQGSRWRQGTSHTRWPYPAMSQARERALPNAHSATGSCQEPYPDAECRRCLSIAHNRFSGSKSKVLLLLGADMQSSFADAGPVLRRPVRLWCEGRGCSNLKGGLRNIAAIRRARITRLGTHSTRQRWPLGVTRKGPSAIGFPPLQG
jgi:hypothetical protein